MEATLTDPTLPKMALISAAQFLFTRCSIQPALKKRMLHGFTVRTPRSKYALRTLFRKRVKELNIDPVLAGRILRHFQESPLTYQSVEVLTHWMRPKPQLLPLTLRLQHVEYVVCGWRSVAFPKQTIPTPIFRGRIANGSEELFQMDLSRIRQADDLFHARIPLVKTRQPLVVMGEFVFGPWIELQQRRQAQAWIWLGHRRSVVSPLHQLSSSTVNLILRLI